LPEAAGAAVPLAAAFCVYLFHLGVDWMWESTAVTVLALACGAVSVGALSNGRSNPSLAVRVAIPVVAVVAMLVQVPGLVSTSKVRSSQSAAEAGDLGAAFERADEAVEAQPWAASPYVQRGVLEEATGGLTAATVDLRRATEREPTNWRPWLLLARVEAKRGRVRPALADYRKARRLRPTSVFFAQSVPSTR
jgi:cytochrome c-type biogenesis protein CcmH/NrfG